MRIGEARKRSVYAFRERITIGRRRLSSVKEPPRASTSSTPTGWAEARIGWPPSEQGNAETSALTRWGRRNSNSGGETLKSLDPTRSTSENSSRPLADARLHSHFQ